MWTVGLFSRMHARTPLHSTPLHSTPLHSTHTDNDRGQHPARVGVALQRRAHQRGGRRVVLDVDVRAHSDERLERGDLPCTLARCAQTPCPCPTSVRSQRAHLPPQPTSLRSSPATVGVASPLRFAPASRQRTRARTCYAALASAHPNLGVSTAGATCSGAAAQAHALHAAEPQAMQLG